ncbi:MAG: hypothetical protein RIF41_20035 [Polyangiaceae bacterium]
MHVSIKELAATIELKNKGVELEVRDPSGNHLGDLIVTKTKLIWCKGRTRRRFGVPVSWNAFIRWMEEE